MKKFMLFCFSLVIIFILFCGFNTKAAEVTLSMVNAASVRTEGTYQGLKFQATFSSTYVGAKEYGFYLALGNHSRTDMVNAIKAGTNVGGNKIVKSYKTGDEKTFAVTIYNIPSTNYVDEITAIAYFNDGGKEAYTSTCVTRSIANVAMSALNSGESAAILTDVASYLAANYMVITDGCNEFNEFTITPFVNTKSSFSDLSSLYEEFIDDVNEACGTSLTTSCTISDFYNTLKEGVGDSDYTIDVDDNIAKVFSGARLVKWKWLLSYFKNLGSNQYYKQADALMKANRTSDSQLYSMESLIYSLWNFFNTDTKSARYTAKTFANESAYDDVNWETYSSYTSATCAELGSKINLPNAPSKNGYSFVKYTNGVSDYNPGDEIDVTSSVLSLKSVFNLVNYTITYNLNGGTNSLSNVGSYNIESSTITLYNATKDGYIFGGWYYESDFSGSVVTSIPSGSYGNKVLYAKWTEPAATNYDISSSDVSVLNTITPNIIVDDDLEPGKYHLSGTGLAASYAERTYTSNINAFTTISDAIAAASANDVIYVFSGTYNNALTISTAGIKIIGPNYSILGKDSRNTEASVNNTITVNANNVSIIGIEITGTNSGITSAQDISNLLIKNVYASGVTGVNISSLKGFIRSTNAINGLEVNGIYASLTYSTNAGIYLTGTVTNAVIKNSYISANSTSSDSVNAIRMDNIAGTLVLDNNEMVYPGNEGIIRLGESSNSCTSIDVYNNIIRGTSTNNTSYLRAYKIPSTATINIIGNYFDYFDASNYVFTIAGAANGGQANIKYNYFGSSVTFKAGISKVTATYENNYYASAQTTPTTDYGVITSLGDLRTAYMASDEYSAYGSNCVY